jgi:hypothetical protein
MQLPARQFSRNVPFVAAIHRYTAAMHSFTGGKPECMTKAGKTIQDKKYFIYTQVVTALS